MKSHASMNRIYRLVWNAALGLWVAVAENAKGKSSGGSARSSVDVVAVNSASRGEGFTLRAPCRAALAWLLAMTFFTSQAQAADAANAAVVAGSGQVATSGLTTTINQSSQNLAIDWTSLSTAANEALVFKQPNTSSIALNRIIGSSPSQFLGSLSANGQVFILNPNGVLFGAGSQANVGGLVASTLSMSNADFMDGKHVFTGSGGAVVNQGTMTAAPGGYLALLAPEVRNEGVMTASLGTALLAAGNKVTLNLDNGSLLGYSIDQGAINALAENKHLIQANGGQVLLSAKALDSLTTATVNNTGIIEARTLQNKAGRILLMGDMATGTVNVAGTLDASAPNGGDGGFVETSAAHVKVASGTRVTTQAATGQTGKWLIDPNDFTIAASGGDMDAATVASNLATTNFEIQTATMGTSGGNGDIHINQALSWSSANTLTLTAERNIAINQGITAASGGLTLNAAGNISAPASVDVGTFILAGGVWSQVGSLPAFSATDFRISGGTFVRALSGDGSSATPYQLSDVYGLQGAGSAGMLGKSYALANDIDASGTRLWNNSAGFKPIGDGTTAFTGTLDGGNHVVRDLTINRPSSDYVGLFGYAGAGSTLQNVGLVGGSVSGASYVGDLVGKNESGSISNAYATGNVSGHRDYIGGLVGYNIDLDGSSSVTNVYATGNVSGLSYVGGLMGYNSKVIGYRPIIKNNLTNAYSTGNVLGIYYVGGLLGYNISDNDPRYGISNVYATGTVTGSPDTYTAGSYVGGLVGYNHMGHISNAYATGNVQVYLGYQSGGNHVGGLVGYNAGGALSKVYASGSVRADEGHYIGGLVGTNTGPIEYAYATGGVHADGEDGQYVGGLVGQNGRLNGGAIDIAFARGTIDNSYAIGDVSGVMHVGGLIGYNIVRSLSCNYLYATGSVSGSTNVGGLVGSSFSGISNAYATGSVSGVSDVGGLVGFGTGRMLNSYWNTDTTGQSSAGAGSFAGVAGLTSAQMMQASSFSGWNTATSGGSTAIWRIYEGHTAPLLRSFMTALTVTANDVSKTYDGSTAVSSSYTLSDGSANSSLILGTAASSTSSKNVGSYSIGISGLYSGQQGYDLSFAVGTATVTAATLTVSGITAASKTYDGRTAATLSGSLSGLVSGDTVTLSQSGSFSDKNAATGKTVSYSSSLSGSDAGNYVLAASNGTTMADITAATLTVSGSTAANKTYDGTTAATVSGGALSGVISGDSVALSQSGTFSDKNAATGKTVTIANSLSGSDAGNYVVAAAGTTADIAAATLTLRVGNVETAALGQEGLGEAYRSALGPLAGVASSGASGSSAAADAEALAAAAAEAGNTGDDE